MTFDILGNLPSDLSPADWELIRPASGSGSKVLFIRKKAETDRKYLAVLKIYKNECKEDAYRELKALTILKGMNNHQLIPPFKKCFLLL